MSTTAVHYLIKRRQIIRGKIFDNATCLIKMFTKKSVRVMRIHRFDIILPFFRKNDVGRLQELVNLFVLYDSIKSIT